MEWTIQSTTDASTFNLEELSWAQVRSDLKKLAPALCDIIDSLGPNKHLTLIKARYPYGAKIIENNKLYLPHKTGESIAIDKASIHDGLKKKLSYCSIPLSFLLNKSCEVFVTSGDTILVS